MADGDQERFGDYLELENYIDALQAGKAAHPPANLTLEQIRIYQMAALFRSAADNVEQPRPDFIIQLKARLLEPDEEQSAQPPAETAQALIQPAEPVEPVTPQPPVPTRTGSTRRARFFSRRGLITGGAIAAASLAVGAGMDHMTHASEPKPAPSNLAMTRGYPVGANPMLNIANSIPTNWHFVTTLAALGEEAIRFTSDTIVGYVVRSETYPAGSKDEDDEKAGKDQDDEKKIIAFSASCPHMGCLVQWKSTERQFHCPCHNAVFNVEGALKPTGYKYALPPLPRLNTKIDEKGDIYVELPYLL